MLKDLYIGLEGYQFLQSKQEHQLIVHVELKREYLPVRCPYCGGGHLHSKGRYLRRARHLDCFGQESVLHIHTRRYQCRDCDKSFLPNLPGVRPYRHSSEPFRDHIYRQHHHGIAASTLSHQQSLGEATVGRIYEQFTARKAAERIRLDCPLYLGIDEHTLHKAHRFATTFCDLKNHKVFEVQPGKSETELSAFLGSLRGRERVRLVCIDLSSPYRRLVRQWFPNAKIVTDRFHAIRLVYGHFITMMRAIAPPIRNQRGYLAALRKAPNKLNTKQRTRLQTLFTQYPQLQILHQKMHQLRTLMNHKHQSKKQCRQHIKELHTHIQWLQNSHLKPLQTLARSLAQWIEPIALMWRFTKNNAITEGFHRKMKLIQRRAYGFRNFHNYRLRVIAQCG